MKTATLAKNIRGISHGNHCSGAGGGGGRSLTGEGYRCLWWRGEVEGEREGEEEGRCGPFSRSESLFFPICWRKREGYPSETQLSPLEDNGERKTERERGEKRVER